MSVSGESFDSIEVSVRSPGVAVMEHRRLWLRKNRKNRLFRLFNRDHIAGDDDADRQTDRSPGKTRFSLAMCTLPIFRSALAALSLLLH